MEANAGLVAGSHMRNELVRIRHDSDGGNKSHSILPNRAASSRLSNLQFICVIIHNRFHHKSFSNLKWQRITLVNMRLR
ncbi:hypothetical protein L6452_43151 [Arctium lappa]|uniref:Uncharacterized protein n=1 Tax=Arctium lappa TaxID=4217 RepID=A0ACB8XLC1_ARCLA|nr:hypothetical protein L6452_43151 [Arctium lappa]